MDRTALGVNGIFFQEELAQEGRLPAHVVALRSALLDFDCTIPDRLGLSTDEDIRCLNDICEGLDISEFERSHITESLAHYKTIKEDAEILHKGEDREAEWQIFFFNNFFNPLAKEMRVTDKDPRRASRIKFYYDYFEHAHNRPWPLFGKFQRFRETDRRGLTEPKPDWVAFYPIYDFASGDRIPTSARWRWRNSPKDSIVENFSRRTLETLAQHGLESNTAGLFRKGRRKSIVLSDCICFPWLIVEHKKAGNNALQCYCQAANAGTAAVMLLQTLSKYTERKSADKHIPPLVTMTTVDKLVRVWITYSCNNSRGFKMNCIWKGDMTVVLDLIKLRAILENLHTWAMRVLRPWISSYIDQWRANFPSGYESSEELESQLDIPAQDTMCLVLAAPSSPVPVDDPDLEDKHRHGIDFREILQKEHQRLIDQFQWILQESLENRNLRHRPPHPSRSVGVQTVVNRTLPSFRSPSEEQTAEILSTPPQIQHSIFQGSSNSRCPLFNMTPSISVHQSAGSGIDPEQSVPRKAAFTWTSPTRQAIFKDAAFRGTDIFKKPIYLPYGHSRFRRIRVKLPDVSSTELAASKPGLVPVSTAPGSQASVATRRLATPRSIAKPTIAPSVKPYFTGLPTHTWGMFSDYQGGPQGVKASQTDLLPTFNPVMFEGAVFDFTAPALNLNRPLPKPSPEPTSYPSSLSIERTSFVQNANTPNSEPRADRAPTPSLESFKEERSTDDDEEWEDTDES